MPNPIKQNFCAHIDDALGWEEWFALKQVSSIH